MNLIESKLSRAIEDARERLLGAGDLTAAQLRKAEDDLAIDGEEHFQYQQTQAEAHAGGLLDRDSALTVYAALGENWNPDNGGWASEADLATKYVVTILMGKLLARKIGTTA